MKGSKTIFLLLVVLGLGAYIWFYEINQLSTAEKKALELQAFDVQVERVNGIGIRTQDYEVELSKTDQGWELAHPKGARAALPVVQQILARIKTLNKGELITPADIRAKGQSLAEYGLSPPRMKLRLKTPGQTRNYEVGDKNPLGNSLYVKEESTQNVMLVSTDLLDVLPDSLMVFRDKALFSLHEEEVQAVDLISEDRTIRLEKRKDEWSLKTPITAAVDQEKVQVLLQKLLQARIDGIVNDPTSEDLENFSLEGSGQVIRLWPANSKVPVELTVGGDLPLNPDQLYVRIAGQEGLVTVSKGLRSVATSPVDLFRDRTLFPLAPERITEISIQRDLQTLRLQKNGDEWNVVDPMTMKADAERVKNMIKTWSNARVEDFVSERPSTGDPLMTVTFYQGTGDAEIQTQFKILNENATPGRVRLSKEGEAGTLVVVPDLVKYAPVEVLPYLSREVLRFDPAQAVRVSLSHGENSMVFVRNGPGESWKIQGTEGEADQQWISGILNRFSKLTAKNLINNNAPFDMGFFGENVPLTRLSVGLAGEEAVNRTLIVHPGSGDVPLVRGVVQGQSLLFELRDEDYNLLQEPLRAED